jgi:hypothetical protein
MNLLHFQLLELLTGSKKARIKTFNPTWTKTTYRYQKNLAIIFDASNASIPKLSHQKMQADWLKENEELMQTFV